MITPNNAQVRRRVVQTACGESPSDLLSVEVQIVDMVTGGTRSVNVGIVGKMIANVHPCGSRAGAHGVRSLAGGHLSPGLMDTHAYLESPHLPPERYAEIVFIWGTIAMLWDPHELVNVLGVEDVRYAVDASRHLPLQVMVVAPSNVPSAPGLEMSGVDSVGTEVETMLNWPEVRGVAEAMDMHGALYSSEWMQEIVQAGLNSGKLIEGHVRGPSGVDLQVHLTVGITSDYELISADNVLEKLCAGPMIEIRGSHPYLLSDIVTALKALSYFSLQIATCTDDVPLDMLLEKGGTIALSNPLIEYGLPMADTLRFATPNAIIRLQRHDLGLVAVGRRTDLVVFDSLEKLMAREVYIGREQLAHAGRLPKPIAPVPGVTPSRGTLSIAPLRANDFVLCVQGIRRGTIRLCHIRGVRFAQQGEVEIQAYDGKVQLSAGFSLVWVKYRYGCHQVIPQIILPEGRGELCGTVAISYSHGSYNLVVLGRDADGMALAASQLITSDGGVALTQRGEILAHVAMSIAGMLSDLPAAELARQFRESRDLSSQVTDWGPPHWVFKVIEGTCLVYNAEPRLTDLGLTDGGSRQIAGLLIARRETPGSTGHNNNSQET